MSRQIWVGTKKINDGDYSHWEREVFRQDNPAQQSTDQSFLYLVGPFRTIRGAKYMVHFSWFGNPHCQTVAESERLGKEYAKLLRGLPKSKKRSAL